MDNEQLKRIADALEVLAAVCKIHNARPDVGGTESHNSVPAMDHDQILKDIKS